MKAGIIVFDDFLQCLKTAIVHIGSGVLNIAQRWRFEFATIKPPFGLSRQPWIGGVEVQPVVVKLIIGEKRGDMAVEAVGLLGVKEQKPPSFLWGEFLCAGQPSIVFCIRRDQGPFKLGNSLHGELFPNGLICTEGLCK